MIEEENLTYAEALWDHVTMDPDELGFRAGDLIRVTETADKHWWFGTTEHHDGWFPAAFVRVSCYCFANFTLELVWVQCNADHLKPDKKYSVHSDYKDFYNKC